MTPEPTQSASAVSAQTIQVPAPVAGSSTTVTMVPGSELAFEFNPGEATMSRSENNLVFESQSGSVVINDFFVVGEGGALPMLRLPEGDLVSSEVVFADSGIDLSTAAGPAAGAPASGGANYNDLAGDILGGVDRMGALTTDGWSTAAAVTDESPVPDVTAIIDAFTFAFVSSPATIEADADGWISGRFVNVLFEGGQPNKHLAAGQEAAPVPGILEFTVDSPNAALTSVTLSGFAAGSVLMVGGASIAITGPAQEVTLTAADLALTIALYPPAGHSDADMTITAIALVTAPNGSTATAVMAAALVVDAVADMAKLEGGDLVVAEQLFTETDNNGVLAAKDEKPEGYDTTEAQTVSLPVAVSFPDLDGSEAHYIKLVGVPGDWDLDEDSLAALGLTLVEAAPEAWASYGYDLAPAEEESDFVTYIFQVTDPDVYASGELAGAIVFETHDWTSERLNSGGENTSGAAEIKVTAIAWEETLSGGEAILDNNYAESEAVVYKVDIAEDKPVISVDGVIVSDETAGLQNGGERNEIALDALPDAVAGVLATLGLQVGNALSAAQSGITYNLHSDGDRDGRVDAADADPKEYAGVVGSKLFVRLGTSGENETPVTDSGWKTTDGTAVYLYEDEASGCVIGYVGALEEGKPSAGSIAFVVAPAGTYGDGENAGSVTFVQYKSLLHLAAKDGSSDKTMEAALNLNVVVRDADGDFSDPVGVSIDVHDDGPGISITPPPDGAKTAISETGLSGAEAVVHTYAGAISVDFGVDGPATDGKAFLWNVSKLDEAGYKATGGADGTGVPLVWEQTGAGASLVLTGKAGDQDVVTVTLTGDPTTDEFSYEEFTYEITLHKPLHHDKTPGKDGQPNPEDKSLELTLPFTVKDGDGSIEVGEVAVTVEDAEPVRATDVKVALSETDLPGGTDRDPHAESNIPGNDNPQADETLVTGSFEAFDFNGEGPHALTPFAWVKPGEGLYKTTDNTNILWEVSEDGLTLTGYPDGGGIADAVIVFTAVGAGEGRVPTGYTVALKGSIRHADNDGRNTNDIKVEFCVMDGDGDTATSAFTVTVHDDSPEIAAPPAAIIVSEPDLADGTDRRHLRDHDKDGDRRDIETIAKGTISVDFGADGPAADGKAFVWDVDSLNKAGHAATDGTPIIWGYAKNADGAENYGIIVGSAKGEPVVTVTMTTDLTDPASLVNNKGALGYTVTLHDSLHHDKAAADKALDLELSFTIKDGDNDEVAPESPLIVTVVDDVPRIGPGGRNIHVHLSETDLPGGADPLHLENDIPGNLHNEARIVGAFGTFNFGADGPAARADKPFEWVEPEEGAYTTTDGTAILWEVVDNGLTMIGYPKGGDVHDPVIIFKATHVNTDGVPSGYRVILKDSIQHDGDGRDVETIEAGFIIRDGDGDTARGSFDVKVHDDSPEIFCGSVEGTVYLSETDLKGGADPRPHLQDNVPGNAHDESKLTGHLSFVFGADGAYVPSEEGDTLKAFTWNAPAAKDAEGEYVYKTANGEGIEWEFADNGLTLIGYPEGGSIDTPAITIKGVFTHDAAGRPNGLTYDVELHMPLKHATSQNHTLADHAPIAHPGEYLDLPLGFTITDGDGDGKDGALTIKIKDDVPCAGHGAVVDTVLEASLRQDFGGEIFASGGLPVHFGADGPALEKPVAWSKSATEAFDGLSVIIDGEVHATTTIVSEDGKTIEVFAGEYTEDRDDPSVIVSIVELGNGEYGYEYVQKHAFANSAGCDTDNLLKSLNLGFTVTDRDGDTAENALLINVMDSIMLSGGAIGVKDETWIEAGKAYDLPLHLDYDSPDGITAIKWDAGPLEKAFALYNKLNPESPLKVEADPTDGDHTLLITQNGEVVLRLTLVATDDGEWKIEYTQYHGLEHLDAGWLPGIILPVGHNDALVLPLSVIASNAEGVSVSNPVLITVLDDGPSIPYGTMTGIVENFQHIGDVLGIVGKLAGLELPKISSLEDVLKLGEQLEAFSETLKEISIGINEVGVDIFVSTLKVIDLVFGTNYYTPLGTVIGGIDRLADMDWSSPGAIWNNIQEMDETFKELGKGLSDAFLHPPLNNWLAESEGNIYGGNISFVGDKEFGFDGAHEDQAVVFSRKGVELMLKLLGIHKTGSDDSLETVRDHDGRENYLPDGAAKVLDVVKAYDGNPENGELVLTFITFENADGSYSYQVITNGPLAHDPTILDKILDRLLNPDTVSAIGEAAEGVLNGLLALNLPVSQLVETIQGFIAMGPDLGRDALMLLPMPIVAQDGDGDKSMGLATVVIRDSVPEFAGHTGKHTVDEANLGWGTSPDEKALSVEGSFEATAFDGIRGVYIEGIGEAKLGQEIDLGHGTITFTRGEGDTINYSYTLTGKADHPYADQTTASIAETLKGGKPAITFQVVDGDGDISRGKGTITIEIHDDKPVATDDFDKLEKGELPGAWVAGGNILDNGDTFGADGRAETDGLTIVDAKGNAIALDGETPVTVEGKYGVLSINGEGEYTYTLNKDLTVEQIPDRSVDFDASQSLVGSGVIGAEGMTLSAVKTDTLVQKIPTENFAALEAFQKDGHSAAVVQHSEWDIRGIVNKGIGVNTGSLDSNELDSITSYEGLIITFDAPAADISITFGKWDTFFNASDSVDIYLYNEDGVQIAKATCTGPQGEWTSSLTGGDTVAHALIVPKAASSVTITSVATRPADALIDDPDWKPQEEFSYFLMDGDGDTAKGTLSIDPGALVIPGAQTVAVVDEARLDTNEYKGSQHGAGSLAAEGSVFLKAYTDDFIANAEITIGDAKITLTGGAWTAENSTSAVSAGDHGVVTGLALEKTGAYEYKLTYTYELTSPVKDGVQDDGVRGAEADGFSLTVNGMEIPVSVTITDDMPFVTGGGSAAVTEGFVAEAEFDGHIAFAFGADGGSFAWDAANAPACQTYGEGGKVIDVFWKANGLTLTGYAGQGGAPVITVTAAVTATGASYKVVSDGGLVHRDGEGAPLDSLDLTLPFILTDGDGDAVPGSTTVSVADTVATFTNILGPGGALTYEDMCPGSFALKAGADGINWTTFRVNGMPVDESGRVTIDGAEFLFTKNVEGAFTGHYTYTAGKTSGTLPYTFSVEDRDGDPATGQVAITVQAPPPAVAWEIPFGTVDESQLLNATDPHFTGTKVNNGALTTTGTLAITSYEALTGLTIGDATIDISDWTAESSTDYYKSLATAEVDNGVVSVKSITLNSAATPPAYTVELEYTLTASTRDHVGEGPGGDQLDDASRPAIIVKAVSGALASEETTARVDILDDAPAGLAPEKLTVDAEGIDPQTKSLNGLWGADGADDVRGATFKPEGEKDPETGFYKTELTSGGKPIYYELSKSADEKEDSVLTAKYCDDQGQWHTVFTAALDAQHNTYTVQMSGSVDRQPDGAGSMKLGGKSLGPVSEIFLTTDGTFRSGDEFTGEKLATVSVIGKGVFSGSNNGLAVNDGDFSAGEAMRFTFEQVQEEVAFRLHTKGKGLDSLKGTWVAYDANGNEVDKGTFPDANGALSIKDSKGGTFHSVEIAVTQGSCLLSHMTFDDGGSLDPLLILPVQIMDKDGDTASADLNITVAAAPKIEGFTLTDNTVHEAGLKEGTGVDHDPLAGDVSMMDKEATGTFTVVGKHDSLKFVINEVEHIISLEEDGSGQITVANGTLAVTRASLDGVTADYDFTYTLTGPARHGEGEDVARLDISLSAGRGEAFCDLAAAGDASFIRVVDDRPVHDYDPTAKTLVNMGADGDGRIDFIIEEGKESGWYTMEGEAIKLYYLDGANNSTVVGKTGPDGAVQFTVTGNSDGTYSFEQHERVTGGPAEFKGTGLGQILKTESASAFYITEQGDFTSAANNDWSIKVTGTRDGKDSTINTRVPKVLDYPSFGVNDGYLSYTWGVKETMTFEVDYLGTNGVKNLLTSMTFDIGGLTLTQSVTWKATYVDADGNTYVNAGGNTGGSGTFEGVLSGIGNYPIAAPEGYYISQVELTPGTNVSCRLRGVSATAEKPLEALDISYTAYDGEGDQMVVPGSDEHTASFKLMPETVDVNALDNAAPDNAAPDMADAGGAEEAVFAMAALDAPDEAVLALAAVDAPDEAAFSPADAGGVDEAAFALAGSGLGDILSTDDIIPGGGMPAFGGPGDQAVHGGDALVWNVGDLRQGGMDTIMDFSLSESRLRFDDIFDREGDIADMLNESAQLQIMTANDNATLLHLIRSFEEGETAAEDIYPTSPDVVAVAVEFAADPNEQFDMLKMQLLTESGGNG